MKKLLKITVAISLITMILVGCGNEDVDNIINNAGIENVNSTLTQDEQTATENNNSDEGEYTLYENTNIGFSMQIPSFWEGKYNTIELEDTYGEDGKIESIQFIHNATVEELGENTGWLFSFCKVTGEQFTEDEPPVMSGQTVILEQAGGYTYFVNFPSGVEYNEADGSESAIEYNNMRNQVNLLIDTFNVAEKEKILMAETSGSKGIFWLDMSIEEAISICNNNNIPRITKDFQGYKFDDRGVIIVENEIDQANGVYYEVLTHGYISLQFSKDERLIRVMMQIPPQVMYDEDLYVQNMFKTEKGIKITDTYADVINVYGEPDMIDEDSEIHYFLNEGLELQYYTFSQDAESEIVWFIYSKK